MCWINLKDVIDTVNVAEGIVIKADRGWFGFCSFGNLGLSSKTVVTHIDCTINVCGKGFKQRCYVVFVEFYVFMWIETE